MVADATGASVIIDGRYRLEDRIASGGMGVVFGAFDERLERRVAVKLLKDSLAGNESYLLRFRREAHSAAALSHENIAAIFDYGEEDGRPYIVMEFVDGEDVARVLAREGRLAPERAATIALQTCRALGGAHARGIVHRDVKTGNIIACNGHEDLVKVTDFGIARAMDETSLTATGQLFGTTDYISPEQAAGEPATPRSDLYSLGVVLYEMLTGLRPFAAESPMASLTLRMSEDVPAPSRARPGIPSGFDDIVARATARDPVDRYPSADAMAEDLRALLDRGAGGGAPTLPETVRVTSSTVPLTSRLDGGATAVLDRVRHRIGASRSDVIRVGLLVFAGIVGLIALLTLSGGGDGGPIAEEKGTPGTSVEVPEGLMQELDDLEEVVSP